MKSDFTIYGLIFKQDGTARNERYTDALNPVNVTVDDRKLEDFLVFARRYARNILFVPTIGDVDLKQSWITFFEDGSNLLVANIATKDIGEIKVTYDTLSNSFRRAPSLKNLIKVAEFIYSRFEKLDGWYAAAEADTDLNRDLSMYIKSYLANELSQLSSALTYLYRLIGQKEITFLTGKLINKDDVWEPTDSRFMPSAEDLFIGNSEIDKLLNASFHLNKIFDAVFHVTSTIVINCQNYFSSSIFNNQYHSPHIALFITFLKLYGYAQDELNKTPRRLLDYYYKEVLAITPRKAISDKAFVIFELSKGFNNYHITKGTALTAGKDQTNKPLTYVTDKDIVINKAQIGAIKTVLIQKNHSGILNYFATTIKGKNVTVPPPLWSPFGTFSKNRQAAVGIGIASTQFYLSKAERNVLMTLELTDSFPFDDIDTLLLHLRLTGEQGWISTANPDDHFVINYLKKTGENILELSFTIAIAQPNAVGAFNPTLHSGGYITNKPILEILLQYPPAPNATGQEAYLAYIEKISKLNALQAITLLNAQVEVRVGSLGQRASFDGVRDLILQNHESDLDSTKPFLPFTALPKVGSSFYIGCNDLYYKPIQSLTVNFEWMLPDNFRSYYDKYFPPYDANKFEATLSILKNQYWKKLDDVSIIDAYAADPKLRLLIIDPQKDTSGAGAPNVKDDVFKFDVTKPNGTIKLKLNYPDFGHDIYPQLITASVMEAASSKMGKVDFYKIIKKQLHDSVISIKYPADVNLPGGSLKVVVYDILSKIKDDAQARAMISEGLNNKLKNVNGSDVTFTDIKQFSAQANAQNKIIVNDDNFIERILRFLKKVKLIDKSIHFDEDKDNVGKIVEDINDVIDKHIDFILPADQEMVELIVSETNSAINKVVSKIVDKLLAARSAAMPDGEAIAAIFKKEVDDANEVINDLIARKISILLAAHDIPPKPYTPLVNALSVSYVSTKKLENKTDQCFQIMPFGVREIYPFAKAQSTTNAAGDVSIFPEYLIGADQADAKPSGLLFIGLKDIQPDQNLSLLFQVAEGSRMTEKRPPQTKWWYLRNNYWQPLPDERMVADSTYDLQTSGIIEIAVPADANRNNTVFAETDLLWFCISAAQDVNAFPQIINVVTQAALVVFQDNINDPKHLRMPLPAGRITALTEKVPSIKSVHQPLPSMQGKMAERDRHYYTRVSERLRHKGRAINNWDYERLVLEHFPFVYKIKCLNNYAAGTFKIGHVTLVPIVADNTLINTRLMRSKASYIQLRDIEQYVRSVASPFVKVHAVNPRWDYVKVACNVAFNNGLDNGYYLKKLNEDLFEFLTPWSTGDDAAVSFSAKIYVSSLISFIDKLPYVDYVTDFYMSQYTLLDNGEEMYCKADDQSTSLIETQYTTGHSILISAPKHDIKLL